MCKAPTKMPYGNWSQRAVSASPEMLQSLMTSCCCSFPFSKKVAGRLRGFSPPLFFFLSSCKIAALLKPALCLCRIMPYHAAQHGLSQLNILILEVEIAPAFSIALAPC